MSSKSLHTLLLEAVDRLRDTLESEVRDRVAIKNDFTTMTRLLSEYLRIYRMLEECYDQTIHTQRRINIRDLLIKTVTRLLDLFWTLTRPTVIQEGQQPPSWPSVATSICTQTQSIDLRIPVPRIVKDDVGPAYALREDLIAKFTKQVEEARAAAEVAKPQPMSVEDASRIIQRAERARRARHETLIKKGIAQQQALIHPRRATREESDREKCANVIRQFWQKFGKRHCEKKRLEREAELIGMKPVPQSPGIAEKVDRTMKRRKEEERRRKQELDAAMAISKTWLQDNRQVDLERRLSELNAEFYNETKLETGKAPAIKPKTNVLQTLMGRCETPPDEELAQLIEDQAAKKTKAKPEAAADKKAAKSSGGGKDKVEVPIPERVQELQASLQGFNDLWNQEGQPPPTDDFDIELTRKEVWTAMLPDIALKCENNLKQELKNLKILEMRRVKKARPPRERKKRQRKVRDPLGGKSDEEILAQLVGLGIACSSPSISFADFVVDESWMGPGPSQAQYAVCRSAAVMEAVLPFACDRDKASDLPKGVLIAGGKGTGKTTLALGTIRGLGATFLNFSPGVLVGKETPTPRILVLMLLKVARTLAPSVILVDDIDRMFGRGKKADASKKFKAQFRKQIRKVKPRDRILLLGTSSQFPLPKPCTTLFNRAIVIPKPDLPTRAAIWDFWLKRKGLVGDGISVNALAFASEGYVAASIARAVHKAHRIKVSRIEPVTPLSDREILLLLAEAPEDEAKPAPNFTYNNFAPTPVLAKKN
jgi:hypothetical protein